MKSASTGAWPLDAMDFLSFIQEKIKVLELDESLLKRSVNDGFSGGEKKRNEIFQMAVLDPRLAILDETDSGWTLTPCASSPPASRSCEVWIRPSWSSPTTSACSITSSRITCTC